MPQTARELRRSTGPPCGQDPCGCFPAAGDDLWGCTDCVLCPRHLHRDPLLLVPECSAPTQCVLVFCRRYHRDTFGLYCIPRARDHVSRLHHVAIFQREQTAGTCEHRHPGDTGHQLVRKAPFWFPRVWVTADEPKVRLQFRDAIYNLSTCTCNEPEGQLSSLAPPPEGGEGSEVTVHVRFCV